LCESRGGGSGGWGSVESRGGGIDGWGSVESRGGGIEGAVSGKLGFMGGGGPMEFVIAILPKRERGVEVEMLKMQQQQQKKKKKAMNIQK